MFKKVSNIGLDMRKGTYNVLFKLEYFLGWRGDIINYVRIIGINGEYFS